MLVACLLGSVSAFGQGYLAFANIGTGVNSPFKDIAGVGLTGTGNYNVEMLVGLTAATVTDSLTPLFAGQFNAGYFNGGSRTVPAADLNGTGQTFVMIRAWSTLGGTVTSYAQAQTTPGASWGATAIGQYLTQSSSQVPASPLAGLPLLNGNGNLTAVPEPTTLALGLLGVAALFIRRRK